MTEKNENGAFKPPRLAKKRPGKRLNITPEMRVEVARLAGLGLTQEQAAEVLGIGITSLKKYLRADYERGIPEAIAKVSGALFRIAMSDGPMAAASCMFYLKCRAAWSEKSRVEFSMDMPADYDQIKQKYERLIERRAMDMVKSGAVPLPAPVETTAITVTPAATTPAPVESKPPRVNKAKVF